MNRILEVFAITSVIITFLSLAPPPAAAQEVGLMSTIEPYWQQKVDYVIHCSLDPADHTLSGRETITYMNSSPDTLQEFYLHLYPNAYREKASDLVKDYLQGTWFILVGLRESQRGWMDVSQLKVDGKETEFSVEGTILSSSFSQPLPPGKRATIEIVFTEKVRKFIGRAGYRGRHYDMAQWYPKMVVYDKNGWNPDQFRQGEFYGEFGDFDFHITLPQEYVIAATGTPVSGDPGWKKNPRPEGEPSPGADNASAASKTVHFRAEKVHDFAWSADPSFVVQDTTYNGYRVMSFYRSGNPSWADSVLARGLRALKWLEQFAGPYGYPQVSIVDALNDGGMEYPMLVMNGSSGEELILHELGHNWFYGMLANDEREEAWMDEGMTQYQTFKYQEKHYGPYGEPYRKTFWSALNPRPTMWEELTRDIISYHRAGFAERVATPHHEFKNCGYEMVYIKSALFMRALCYYVGEENFHQILHTYFDRWKFKHVDEEAFLSVCQEISGMDLGEFFKQWLHSTKDCDYRISRFKVDRQGDLYQAKVKIDRKGEMIMPLTLAFRLENGNTVSERVDGFLRTVEKTFPFDTRPVSVAINPENRILDIYQVDNFSPRRRALTWDFPFNQYYPPDAYQFRVLPIGYYNDIDGGKGGIRLRGSYDDTYKKFTLQGLYGKESETLDLYGSLEHPLGMLGREAELRARGYIREGRQGVSLRLYKTRRHYYSDPLAKHYSLGFAYQELTDTAYVFPYTYEEGMNLQVNFGLALYPRTDVFNSSLYLGLARSFWGSDFRYEKLTFITRLRPSSLWPLPVRPRMRLFYGRSTIDPPLQEMYNLAGAGVLDKEDLFWLRSRGAFWKDYYNNYHLPGDANLRGYFNGDFSFKKIFSNNIEVAFPLPLPRVGPLARHRMRREFYLFYDWGKVLDKRPQEFLPPGLWASLDKEIFNDVLQDFGLGLKVWKLSAEFPLYISHPSLTGDRENWDFRWTIGLESLF